MGKATARFEEAVDLISFGLRSAPACRRGNVNRANRYVSYNPPWQTTIRIWARSRHRWRDRLSSRRWLVGQSASTPRRKGRAAVGDDGLSAP